MKLALSEALHYLGSLPAETVELIVSDITALENEHGNHSKEMTQIINKLRDQRGKKFTILEAISKDATQLIAADGPEAFQELLQKAVAAVDEELTNDAVRTLDLLDQVLDMTQDIEEILNPYADFTVNVVPGEIDKWKP